MKKLPTYILTLSLGIALVLPSAAFARHNDDNDYSREYFNSVDRDDLDDDIVKEVPIPVLFGVEYNDIRSDFGDPRGDGTREHEGQDIFAPEGTPIVSPTDAIVLSTGEGEGSGVYIYTANPGGETFRFMHLKDVADLDRGDELKIGD